MNKIKRTFIHGVILTIFILLKQTAFAQEPPKYVLNALNAVEKLIQSEGDEAIQKFIQESMVVDNKKADYKNLAEHLKSIRAETKDLTDDISVEAEPDGVSLYLSARGVTKKLKIELGPNGIYDLYMTKAPEPIILTENNIQQTIDRLEEEGMSGVVYVKKDGKILMKHAFGFANKELKIRNTVQTIFGTGSRPIDYTVAAIYLLNQQNKIGLDETIDKYFENVPEDKKSITIQDLLTGKSGLPDFFHTEEDWDPDLAWINRETAEKRLLSQHLLFAPGQDQKHSHAAFGLLAALIERVSGMEYYQFLKKNFFDPAGMTATGEYGITLGHSISEFAEGDGPQFVGLPNIPTNWGPTSWLVKGSGGMYSNLDDLLKFYEYLRSGKVLDKEHMQPFLRQSINSDGSDRGFELFSAFISPDDELYIFINSKSDPAQMRQLFGAFEKFLDSKR